MKLTLIRLSVLIGILIVFIAPLGRSVQAQSRQPWTLVWGDEFSGTTIDRSNWTFDIGAGGWGNNELEFYTDRPVNARVEDGKLVIEARKEEFGIRGNPYTSARMTTQKLHEWTSGRIEARIKIPYGQGIWPAFWLLGTSASWPTGGEIDIMENIGKEPSIVHGSLHGPTYSKTSTFTLDTGKFADDYHVYAVEWYADHIDWFVDNHKYFTQSTDTVKGKWVFNNPAFYIILNVAVGGGWPGNPDETSVFPQYMYVDYVRVYQNDVF